MNHAHIKKTNINWYVKYMKRWLKEESTCQPHSFLNLSKYLIKVFLMVSFNPCTVWAEPRTLWKQGGHPFFLFLLSLHVHILGALFEKSQGWAKTDRQRNLESAATYFYYLGSNAVLSQHAALAHRLELIFKDRNRQKDRKKSSVELTLTVRSFMD